MSLCFYVLKFLCLRNAKEANCKTVKDMNFLIAILANLLRQVPQFSTIIAPNFSCRLTD